MWSRPETAARRAASDAGFTLVETLVAFCVLATLMGVLYRSVVDLRLGANAAGARGRAALVARSLLEESLAARALPDGTTSGMRDGLAWSREAKPANLSAQLAPPAPPPGQTGAAPAPAWHTQRLRIRVETGGRPVEVEAIHLTGGA